MYVATIKTRESIQTIKRVWFLLLLFLFPIICSAQTPTIIQFVDSASNAGNEVGNDFNINLDAIPTNDCVVLFLTYNHLATDPTITDLQSPGGPGASNLGTQNTWTLAKKQSNTGNGTTNDSAIWYTLGGTVAGTQFIKVHFASTLLNFKRMAVVSYNTDCTLKGTGSAQGLTGPTMSSGSFTPSVNGTLILNFGMDANGGFPGNAPNATGFTAGSSFTLLEGNRMGSALISWAQFFVQSTAAAINPGITVSGDTDTDNMGVSAAFNPASQGSDFAAGIIVRSIFHVFPGATYPQTVNVPCGFGNPNHFIFVHSAGVNQDALTGVVIANPTKTLTKHSIDANDTSQVYSSDDGTLSLTSTMTTTISETGTPSGGAHMLYCVSGAATSPFDTVAGNGTTVTAATTTTQSRIATDTTVTVNTNTIANNDFLMWESEIIQVTSGGGTGTLTISRGLRGTTAASHATTTNLVETNQTNLPSITPSTKNGLIIFSAAFGTGPPDNGSPGPLDTMFYLGETDTGGNDAADYYSHYYNPSTATVNNTIVLHNSGNLTSINYVGVAYKAAPIGPQPNLSIGGKLIQGGKIVN